MYTALCIRTSCSLLMYSTKKLAVNHNCCLWDGVRNYVFCICTCSCLLMRDYSYVNVYIGNYSTLAKYKRKVNVCGDTHSDILRR